MVAMQIDRRALLLGGMLAAAVLGAGVAAALVGDDAAGRRGVVTTARTVVSTTVAVSVSVSVPDPVTVAARPRVPAVAGVRLDVASRLLDAAGLRRKVDGGGLFGVLDDTGWLVCSAEPLPGTEVDLGAEVVVHVERAC
jgi:hypothetical protein